MTHLALVSTALLALAPVVDGWKPGPGGADTKTQTDTAAVLKSYEGLKATAGRDADAQVKLALWCEAHGLTAERLRHLAAAVLTDPNHVRARGLMGLLAYRGRWETPDSVSAKVKADEALAKTLAEYNARRAALDGRLGAGTSDGAGRPGPRRVGRAEAAREHAALGMWCEKHGLKAEAVAHFTQAVVLDPYRDATWKHLGYVRYDGRWVSREQAAAEQKEAEAQKRADRQWEPLLRRWRGWLADKARRDEAREALAGVNDPRAVPSVARVFGEGSDTDQLVAAEVLGRIDTPASTRGLAALAVLSRSAAVRSAATEALRGREPRDYARPLVERIHFPMSYRVRPVKGPGSPGALEVETPRFKMLRTYDAPPAFQLGANFYGYVGYDSNGLPVAARGKELDKMAREGPVQRAADLEAIEARTARQIADANLKAVASQQRLIADVNDIEAANAVTTACNARIASVLRATLGGPDSADDEDGWNQWWYDRLGYRYEPPPQQQVAVNAAPQLPPPYVMSCFAAGTAVRTRDGRRPIETLRVGDQVLTQDVATGGLSFEPVLVVHHNPPGETVELALDNGEALTASVYHRFWRAGLGWAMARELKPGDVLRTLSGPARVVSAKAGPVVPVFNLDVARTRTFFVGDHDALVHDNTPPDPRLVPFDAADPGLAARR
jgi:hypothetical protein